MAFMAWPGRFTARGLRGEMKFLSQALRSGASWLPPFCSWGLMPIQDGLADKNWYPYQVAQLPRAAPKMLGCPGSFPSPHDWRIIGEQDEP